LVAPCIRHGIGGNGQSTHRHRDNEGEIDWALTRWYAQNLRELQFSADGDELSLLGDPQSGMWHEYWIYSGQRIIDDLAYACHAVKMANDDAAPPSAKQPSVLTSLRRKKQWWEDGA
jgi:hypothetical protein